MAGNMQPMGGPGGPGGPGMMPQQQPQQFPNSANGNALKGQMQNYLLHAIKNCPPPPSGPTWHNNLTLQERLGKAMALATNVHLAQQGGNNIDIARIAEFAASFERETYHKAPSKEAWSQAIDNKIHDFFQKRVQNAHTLQNELNQNYNAQAQAQQHQQNMMGMQFAQQMGRGMGPPNFQQMQRPVQMPNMQAQQQQRQQQQQQFRPQQQQQPQQFQQQQQQQFPQQQFQQQQQQQQLPMGMANNMSSQGGPGMGQNPSMMGMQQNRAPLMQELAKLAPGDKKKVQDLATKMLAEATPDKRQLAQSVISQRIPPDQLQKMMAQGHNPMHLYFQQQAFQILRANAQNVQARQPAQGQGQPGQQGGQQNLNPGQAPMMQQQASRQSFQQRQNMANPQATNDFNQQFNNTNMDSIIDQQMKGFMAQESGQPVVPATNSRPPSSQPMSASMSNQNQNQNQNQTPRPPQQQSTQQQTQQQQQQLAMQMRMNQQTQQNQAQLHPQAQMPQQGVGTSQSPGMGTLNTPVGRPANGMDQSNAQGIQNFAGQPFKQAMQANPNLMNAFMNAIPPEQRSQVYAMPQEQLQAVVYKWQSARRENLQGQQNQMQQHRPPSQMGQAANMNRQPVQGMPPQMGQPNGFNQRVQPPTPPTSQAQTMMDSMDLPPNLHQQEPFINMPQEVRKWKDLRAWLSQNPNGIPANVRSSLGTLQHRQFQAIMQKRMQDKMGQNTNMPQNMMQGQPQQQPQSQPQPPQQQIQQQNMQRPVQNGLPQGLPQHLQHVSPNEIASVRQNHNIAPTTSDEQVRRYVQTMRLQRWKQMPEAQRAQMLAQMQAQGQQTGPNGHAQQPAPMQTLATPQQAPAPTPNSAQNSQPKQATPAKAQTPSANKNKKAAQPAQGAKNLKRPSGDISTDGNNAQQQRKGSQQQAAKNANATAVSVEDGNAVQAKKPTQQGSDGSDNLSRLRTIGQEEQKNFPQESMPDIQMTPSEYNVTVERLRRIVVDMGKIGRGLSKWYGISRDDDRARAFFRMRLRIIRQFLDGEKMEKPKPTFSINTAELDQSRNMLEGMARDIAQHFKPKQALQGQGQGVQPDGQNLAQASNAQEFANQQQRLISQKQQQQLMQQQQMQAQQAQKAQQVRSEQDQSAPAPLNAANLEKNTQAFKNQKANKGSKAPSAPTTTQPPFQIPGSSPHGNPSYMSKPKDIQLQIPAKKRAKLDKQAGQTSQTATPSPQVATKTPPVPQPQSQKPQEPAKPAVLCKDPECQMSMEGYPNAEALERHVQEEHIKPKQDPVKFLAENLALALGLESDGTPKKGQKQAPPPMSRGASKQGVSALGTPKSEPGSMNRSTSIQSKADPKAKSAPASPKMPFDAQQIFTKLGFPSGISSIAWDPSALRNLTPKETPESAKDSGASEPNTEVFDMSLPDFAMDWGWRTSNEDILLGPSIPWKQEYVPQPGDDELLQNNNYKETDWSEVDLWNTTLPNQMDTTGWSMDVA